MPELPEIVAIASGLNDYIKGEVIFNIRVFWESMIDKNSLNINSVVGSRVLSVEHKGKFLVVHTSVEKVMVFHLRLNGKIEFGDGIDDKGIVFECGNEKKFCFYDPRRLATISVVNSPEEIPTIKNMGPEPLSEAFSYEYFKDNFIKRKKMVKALLMDQSVVAGIGNIYSDEILFRAKIHPLRKAHTLTPEEAQTLFKVTKELIRQACDLKGTKHYTGIGKFDSHLKVYQREGKPCAVCGTPIEVTTVGSRKSRYCPKCQPIS